MWLGSVNSCRLVSTIVLVLCPTEMVMMMLVVVQMVRVVVVVMMMMRVMMMMMMMRVTGREALVGAAHAYQVQLVDSIEHVGDPL